MAGHSKWANIKHRKEVQDARKSALFSKLIRQLEIAAREGALPESNFKLKLAIEQARAANLSLTQIERAISKGAGLDKAKSELLEATYEGFGPGGAALVVEALTDNRNRTSAEIRHLFSQFGGSLASAGAVVWQFSPQGKLETEKGELSEEELTMKAIDAGAEAVEREDNLFLIYTKPLELGQVRDQLEAAGIKVKRAELTLLAKNTVAVTEPALAERLLKLLEALDGHPDVKEVYSNFDIPDELLLSLTTPKES